MENALIALKKYFGYDSFRPMQADIVQAVYDRKDTIVLMPTGGGKSICYQIPALTLPGVTIVISPLIALMKDQVEGLRANGVPAAFINSTSDSATVIKTENDAVDGHLKILYVSPEKMVTQNFQTFLKRLKVSLVAVDEAHCISAWGHDFRPEYTQLKFLRHQLPNVPMMALTATADKLTRKDMVTQLGMTEPAVFISSFDRPNITLNVRPGQKRFEQIVDFLKKNPDQSGIIYCLSRRSCEEISNKLNDKGFKTDYYHADLPLQRRSKVQEDFINDRTPIICATIAFGMGIDKSNVRFVMHYNLPRNLEGYYQEIGRAGRDGLPANALLFFSYGDVMAYRDMINDGEGDPAQKELKIAKLNRMYEFAEAPVCRRKTVLAYFDEPLDQNCGNCDVCQNPPRYFDGTVAAQKALSAIKRTNERVGMNMLVNILRGSRNREIIDLRYDQIKTYGAGREYSFDDWLYFITQMLHLGVIEIAYDDNHRLRVTTFGNDLLFNNKKLQLAMPVTQEKKEAVKKEKEIVEKIKPATKTQGLRDELFERLRVLRRDIAVQAGIPPYQVFSDATLTEMCDKKPLADTDLLMVSGVGEKKLQMFGEAFLAEIRRFIMEKESEGVKVQGTTYLVSFEMYRKGQSVEQIALQRGISPTTVVGHLCAMYERGQDLDLSPWISPEELDIIKGALPLFSEPYALKDLFEHFYQQYSFEKLRWGIAAERREKAMNAVAEE
jgi:ATP-dependent DNA helicase RecQ